jgi:hypothetical protein
MFVLLFVALLLFQFAAELLPRIARLLAFAVQYYPDENSLFKEVENALRKPLL